MAFFKKKITSVVGGGNTALEDAIFLSRICDQVYLIHRRDKFRADQILVDAINKIDNIKPIYDTVVSSIKGDKFVNKIAIKTGDVEREIDVSAVFIAIGNVPNNGIFKGKLDLSEGDYIKVDEHLRTSELGVFAAGDGRVTPLRQIITAAADGALAAFSASVYLAK